MPFRERIKKAFRSSSPGSSLRKSSTQRSDATTRDPRWPSNVYAPGEPMPRPKYRAPVKPEHKEKLESFSWGAAWRRKSHASEYSPMGSRMPSRAPSLLSRKSFGGKSGRRASVGEKSTRGSIGGKSDGVPETDGGQMRSRGAARPTRLSAEIEAEGDDDVTNVGLSRVQSREKEIPPSHSRQLSAISAHHKSSLPGANGSMSHQPMDSAVAHSSVEPDLPFTEEELALAMKRSHLAVPVQT
ncbi:hypothetical protein MBLNU459_g7548t1 [Dothideomycetes sp. NU459]